ncbi:uncharacterized protein LOC133799894 [Humulus lupulus]|uniref:uncharacterized protein LOC133799894 n=1 Tax=Humulus lupulus TaxID=3486 RepID=UPI002B4179BC|nr:uncharacterized protein LOC133799894 [Humulus lupulus]
MGIVRQEIQAAQFELKPVMFQMLQTVGQFSGIPTEDPHLHLRLFIEVSDSFMLPRVTEDALRLKLFPYSLRDKARAWLNSLPSDFVRTWQELAERFLMKYFPPTKNAKLHNEITSFQQLDEESLYEAWERFKELLRKFPHHGIPHCIQMETFYNGLNAHTRMVVDASANGALLAKSYNEWPTSKFSTSRKVAGIHDVDAITSLVAQVFSISNMLKTMNMGMNQSMGQPMGTQMGPMENISCPIMRQHPNFSWSNQGAGPSNSSMPPRPNFPPSYPPQAPQQRPQQKAMQSSSLENMLKEYIVKNEAMIQSQAASLRNLEIQVGHLANEMRSRPQGSLPSDTINPRGEGKEDCKAINLRSGKELENSKTNSGHEGEPSSIQINEEIKKDAEIPSVQKSASAQNAAASAPRQLNFKAATSISPTNKLPPKMKDPGSFTIPCTIGDSYSGMALCDLGASINLMPMSVFKRLGIGEVRPTTVTLQLADRSLAHPDGKIEHVLVRVDKFIFPADFFVLDYETDIEVPIILGRPFLATGRTLMDVEKGELTMRAQEEQVTFKVFIPIRSPDEVGDCFAITVKNSNMEEEVPIRYSKKVRTRPSPKEFESNNEIGASINKVPSHLQEPHRKKKKKKKCGRKAHSQRFEVGQRVCFSNSQMKASSRHLTSSFSDSFLIIKVFPCGALDLRDEISGRKLKVKGKELKFGGGEVKQNKTSLILKGP